MKHKLKLSIQWGICAGMQITNIQPSLSQSLKFGYMIYDIITAPVLIGIFTLIHHYK